MRSAILSFSTKDSAVSIGVSFVPRGRAIGIDVVLRSPCRQVAQASLLERADQFVVRKGHREALANDRALLAFPG